MKEIQLYYAQSRLVRTGAEAGRSLEFTVLVRNLAFEKKVDVFWAGADGIWRTLRAAYLRPAAADMELWRAAASFPEAEGKFLRGPVQFALRYRVNGQEYWDNNSGRNYAIETERAVTAPADFPMLHLGFSERIERGSRAYPVVLALRRSVNAVKAGVVWTRNGWSSRHETLCTPKGGCRRHAGGRLVVPSGGGAWAAWTCELELKDAFQVEYALFCETSEGRIWDNNFGRNYRARRSTLKVLTLNLHCYQEEEQDRKFARIARAVRDLDIDIVCLQEVGESWNGGAGDWMTNAARIIREKLKRSHRLHYHLHTDWSHIGFDRFREGCAILSRYKILAADARYVSTGRNIHDIHARKVVMARIHVPYMGVVNVFSVHLSWWSGGFREQFGGLREWADSLSTPDLAATLLCGDFNSEPCSDGYSMVAGTGQYEDQFLAATSPRAFEKIYRHERRDFNDLHDDHRIDYIFMNRHGKLKPVSARSLFANGDYGRVSDHPGYLVEFEPA